MELKQNSALMASDSKIKKLQQLADKNSAVAIHEIFKTVVGVTE
ncbi:MAG: hypothetical protein QG670_1014 [Thermoproteota archaeon]|nr:hypothetical protein [Thermoproteota archaeon]